jgi:hypothetical protein
MDRRLSGPQRRSGLHGKVKNSYSDPLVVQPVASRYGDCAIPALNKMYREVQIPKSLIMHYSKDELAYFPLIRHGSHIKRKRLGHTQIHRQLGDLINLSVTVTEKEYETLSE